MSKSKLKADLKNIERQIKELNKEWEATQERIEELQQNETKIVMRLNSLIHYKNILQKEIGR